MLITTLASLVGVLLFLAVMMWATISDIRSRRVPNWLIGALTLCYPPLALASGAETHEVVLGFFSAAALLGAGMYCFSRGWVSAGGVKLLAVSALWLGIGLVPGLVILSGFFGLLILLATRVGMNLSARAGQGHVILPSNGIPYGPAVAGAALLLLQTSHWTEALT
ncbi:MAG: prepilin peptidase [Pseudomonadota bacterium]